MELVGKSEHQSILVVLMHSCCHIKERTCLKKEVFLTPHFCFEENPVGVVVVSLWATYVCGTIAI